VLDGEFGHAGLGDGSVDPRWTVLAERLTAIESESFCHGLSFAATPLAHTDCRSIATWTAYPASPLAVNEDCVVGKDKAKKRGRRIRAAGGRVTMKPCTARPEGEYCASLNHIVVDGGAEEFWTCSCGRRYNANGHRRFLADNPDWPGDEAATAEVGPSARP